MAFTNNRKRYTKLSIPSKIEFNIQKGPPEASQEGSYSINLNGRPTLFIRKFLNLKFYS